MDRASIWKDPLFVRSTYILNEAEVLVPSEMDDVSFITSLHSLRLRRLVKLIKLSDCRRLCLDHGILRTSFHDAPWHCALLRRTPKSNDSPLVAMAEHDGLLYSHHAMVPFRIFSSIFAKC